MLIFQLGKFPQIEVIVCMYNQNTFVIFDDLENSVFRRALEHIKSNNKIDKPGAMRRKIFIFFDDYGAQKRLFSCAHVCRIAIFHVPLCT